MSGRTAWDCFWTAVALIAMLSGTAVAAYWPLTPVNPTTSTGRRKALAEWIASPRSPLTARVVFFAGAGIKCGVTHGETDELGFHAVEPAHDVTDLHATVLHLLGLDPRRLEVPGRKRLEIDHGEPIHGILA